MKHRIATKSTEQQKLAQYSLNCTKELDSLPGMLPNSLALAITLVMCLVVSLLSGEGGARHPSGHMESLQGRGSLWNTSFHTHTYSPERTNLLCYLLWWRHPVNVLDYLAVDAVTKCCPYELPQQPSDMSSETLTPKRWRQSNTDLYHTIQPPPPKKIFFTYNHVRIQTTPQISFFMK